MPDLIYLLISYSDDETLYILSRLNRHLRSILSQDKYKVKILNFKFKTAQKSLDKVVKKIAKGELIDTTVWKKDEKSMDIYL